MAGSLVGPAPWQAYLPWREAFYALLDPALYTPAWLDGEVACGRFHLFTGAHSAILCSLKSFPTGLKEIHGEAAVGKLGEISSHLIPQAETWAKSIGCRSASISSREGWAKVLNRQGYSIYQTTMRKAL